ncbi:MAG: tRNA (N(6)-L-threonylcarbamoyladenosine(37)-C(2))-methylthiotransferase MtaB [Anaerolineae bacterium]|nr:tRNA (N(6)-L-threonylcarbamoyladenosine(37)-C(2))-methylthiotransferase MtaB [Anaerolineae bacterium]
MRIHVSSLGCKLNQSEMDDLAARLARNGHQIVASAGDADLCILNTCAVTHVAAQKSRQALGRLHRDNPSARLVAAGCYADLFPAELSSLPGVELVVGNRQKERLADLLGRAEGDGVDRPIPHSRTRAFVNIQDGCDNACTYCVIRLARGPQRSRTLAEILADVQARVEVGCQEVVLTGVHIGAYGRDLPAADDGSAAPDLWGLVARLLSETDIARLRLSSIEPWDLPEWALRSWADPRLCPHLHLPLQSGSDAVLRRMGRRYTAAQFAALIAAARAAIPDLAVTTDLIVGFPGETGAEFAESLALVEALGFARAHVFPYSARPGTVAAGLPGQILPRAKAERAQAMRAVAAAGERAFCQRFVGRTMSVLWETSRPGEDGPLWNGLTGNYLRVQAACPADLANRITPARLVALEGRALQGSVET